MPKGIVLAPSNTNPLPNGSAGLWMNNSNNFMFVDQSGTTQNISTGASGAGIYVSITNASGSTITKGSVVSINILGELQLLDVSAPTNASKFVGIASGNIPNNTIGTICVSGLVANLTTSFSFGDEIFAGETPGSITNLPPSIGVNGFQAGDYVIRIGVLFKNTVNPSQKDLLISPSIVGTL